MTESVWSHRDLLGIEPLLASDLRLLLNTARSFEDVSTRSIKKVPALRGRVVVNLFFEDSTRTRASFSLAASRLSADVLDFSAKGSSVAKGETLTDTARTIEAMGVDAIVCRHHQSGAAVQLAQAVQCSVINAGDGQHEHPTQALLDAYTVAKRYDRLDSFDLTGLHIGIVGDIAHSRVARSNIFLLTKLGAQVTLIGPPALAPGAMAKISPEHAGQVAVSHDFDAVLPELDVVNMLRVQFERLKGPAFPSSREYTHCYGLTVQRMQQAKPNILVMHPGPMNRGMEIESAVADGPNSRVLQQVSHGLAVRMAVLFHTTQAATAAKKLSNETSANT